jgi:hypothetical protein
MNSIGDEITNDKSFSDKMTNTNRNIYKLIDIEITIYFKKEII